MNCSMNTQLIKIRLGLAVNAAKRISQRILVAVVFMRTPLILLCSIGIFTATVDALHKTLFGKYCTAESGLENKICVIATLIISFMVYFGVMITVSTLSLLVLVQSKNQTPKSRRGEYNISIDTPVEPLV